jgi:hypothetical protein
VELLPLLRRAPQPGARPLFPTKPLDIQIIFTLVDVRLDRE